MFVTRCDVNTLSSPRTTVSSILPSLTQTKEEDIASEMSQRPVHREKNFVITEIKWRRNHSEHHGTAQAWDRSSFCAKRLLLLRIRNLEFRNVARSHEQVTLFGQDEEALWPARVEDLWRYRPASVAVYSYFKLSTHLMPAITLAQGLTNFFFLPITQKYNYLRRHYPSWFERERKHWLFKFKRFIKSIYTENAIINIKSIKLMRYNQLISSLWNKRMYLKTYLSSGFREIMFYFWYNNIKVVVFWCQSKLDTVCWVQSISLVCF
jgi:hypothetical protein